MRLQSLAHEHAHNLIPPYARKYWQQEDGNKHTDRDGVWSSNQPRFSPRFSQMSHNIAESGFLRNLGWQCRTYRRWLCENLERLSFFHAPTWTYRAAAVPFEDNVEGVVSTKQEQVSSTRLEFFWLPLKDSWRWHVMSNSGDAGRAQIKIASQPPPPPSLSNCIAPAGVPALLLLHREYMLLHPSGPLVCTSGWGLLDVCLWAVVVAVGCVLWVQVLHFFCVFKSACFRACVRAYVVMVRTYTRTH